MDKVIKEYKDKLVGLTQTELEAEWDGVCSVFHKEKERIEKKKEESKNRTKIKTSGGAMF